MASRLPTLCLTATLVPLAACLGPNPLADADTETDESTDDSDSSSGSGSESDATDSSSDDTEDTSDTGDPCTNGEQDGDETDVDCGGSCSPCGDDQGCADPGDCQSGVCEDETCQPPSCDDDVQNGDEVGVDCGGDCALCEATPLLAELDDFESSDARHPTAAMFDDGTFALAYVGATDNRARFFDVAGAGTGPSVAVAAGLTVVDPDTMPIQPSALRSTVELLAVGDVGGPSALHLERVSARVQTGGAVPVNGQLARGVSLAVDGDIVYATWTQDDDVMLRRWDHADGGWLEAGPINVDDEAGTHEGAHPDVFLTDEFLAITWARCTLDCQVAVRRFADGQWLESPVEVTAELDGFHHQPKISVGADGRAMVVWTEVGFGQHFPWAAVLDEDLQLSGAIWPLQDLIVPAEPAVDVLALADDSFAVAWVDQDGDAVHLRRFVDADIPKLMIADEAPWGTIVDATSVALAGIDGRFVVTWSADVDGVRQVQGQVFEY